MTYRRWATRFPFRASVLALVAGLLCTLSAPGVAQTFCYDAYLGGMKVGAARVRVHLTDDDYQVDGAAWAGGLLDALTTWRTEFRATGSQTTAGAELGEYHYTERKRGKRRVVTVRDGVLHQTKNGEKRRNRHAFPGTDVLTALFVEPACPDTYELHSGRHGYQMIRTDENRSESSAGSTLKTTEGKAAEDNKAEDAEDEVICRYDVVDDDGDRYRADIAFTERDGLTVPQRISLHGFVNGRIQLVDVPSVAIESPALRSANVTLMSEGEGEDVGRPVLENNEEQPLCVKPG